MKRKLLSVLLVFVMVFGLTACNLFTVNEKKDMERIVATVSSPNENGEGTYEDTITKRELANGIANYASTLSSYGYSNEDIIDYVLNNLVKARMYIQEGARYIINYMLADDSLKSNVAGKDMNYFMKGTEEEPAYKTIQVLLADYSETEDGLRNALYNAAVNSIVESITSSIDSNVETIKASYGIDTDEEEEEEEETEKEPRATRTKTEEEKEPVVIELPENATDAEKVAMLEKPWEIALSLADVEDVSYETSAYGTLTEKEIRKRAIKKLKITLESNDYTVESYFVEQLENSLEYAILDRYQVLLEGSVNVTLEELQQNYDALLKQDIQAGEADPSNYPTRLESVSDSTFVLYHPMTGYGYVKHILLQFDDVQAHELKVKQASTSVVSDIETFRAQLLGNIAVRDLTEYQEKGEIKYVVAGDAEAKTLSYKQYDVISETLEALAKVENAASITSITYTAKDAEEGETVTVTVGAGADYATLSEAIAAIAKAQTGSDYYLGYGEATVTEFYNYFKSVFGSTDLNAEVALSEAAKQDSVSDIGKVYQVAHGATTEFASYSDLIDTFIDWIFMFNEDPGMFNNTTDYLSKPGVDLGQTETFVKEFAEASRTVVALGEGAYTIIPSDYGYHLVICTDALNIDGGVTKLEDNAEALLAELNKGSDADLSLEQKATLTAKIFNIIYDTKLNAVYNTELAEKEKLYEAEDGTRKVVINNKVFENIIDEYFA
ncbi:MAG: hypothetical protein IJF71_00510 [Clostridia bacterium]|nr:hypothetical protein [Clostridia bacterium]